MIKDPSHGAGSCAEMESQMKIFGKVCSALCTIIIVAFAAMAGVLVLPVLFGCKNMAVVSGSMEPGIPVGSLVVVKEVEPESLKAGDVISYRMSGDTMVTHRIAEIDTQNGQVITKGDANEAADANPVAFSDVVGRKLFHVPFLGYLSIYIKTPLGIVGACAVLIVLILLNYLPTVFEPEEEKHSAA